MPLTMCRRGRLRKSFFAALEGIAGKHVLFVCLVSVCLFGIAIGRTEASAVTVDIVTTPRLHDIRPDLHLVRVTLHLWQHGAPLQRGHLQLKVTAPPRAALLSTDFPIVEGTDLLVLASTVQDGTFTFAYLFPMRGTYTFDLTITPVPGGPDVAPTSLRQTARLRENPAEVRHAWLLIVGLFALGGIAGVVLARSAAAREALPASPTLVLLALLASAWAPEYAVAEVPPAHQGSQGDAAWRLEVRPTPVSATVGQLVQFTIVLSKDGKVFPQPTQVSIEAHHVEDDNRVFQATTYAPDGRTLQHLQFFDGAPHTVIVTARPANGDATTVAPLQAVVEMDVQGVHPPMAIKLRTLALLLSVLVVGMVVGFFLPGTGKG